MAKICIVVFEKKRYYDFLECASRSQKIVSRTPKGPRTPV